MPETETYLKAKKRVTKTTYDKERLMSLYIDGNAAREIKEPPKPKKPLTEEEKARRRRAAQERAHRKRILEIQRKAIRTIVVLIAMGISLFLIVVVLNGSVIGNGLMVEITKLEQKYYTISSQNDSKEYDINRSVNLSEIIKAAESYGMQRGDSNQVITYKGDDSEYIQVFSSVSSD